MVFNFASSDPAQDSDDFNPAFRPTPSSSPLVTLCQPCEYTCTFTKTIRRLVAADASLVLRAPASAFPDDETRGRYAETSFHGINLDAHPEFHQRQLKEFTLKELKVATQNFSKKKIIGKGGFGAVYEGRLADGSLVAIKRMSKDSSQGTSEFEREVTFGSIIPPRHNLLPMFGFCRTPKCRDLLLVSPLMINKSLDYHLTKLEGRPPLDWETRLNIALGIARGLCYLHDLNIVHGDVKPPNIMLDEEFEPHIGDFGSVKLTDRRHTGYLVDGIKGAPVLPRNESEAVPHSEDFYLMKKIRSTYGYMAPEYAMMGKYSVKMDVFAFGITLLQLVTGQRATIGKDPYVTLGDWVEELALKGSWEIVVDPYLPDQRGQEEIKKVTQLALLCTHRVPRRRPSMAQVVQLLKGRRIGERWEDYCRLDKFLNSIESTSNRLPE